MMEVEAITLIVQLMSSGMDLIAKANEISATILKQKQEGRTEWTAEEVATVLNADDMARLRLIAAIQTLKDQPLAAKVATK